MSEESCPNSVPGLTNMPKKYQTGKLEPISEPISEPNLEFFAVQQTGFPSFKYLIKKTVKSTKKFIEDH